MARQIFYEDEMVALQDLMDPGRSSFYRLVRGRAPGVWPLVCSLFPPGTTNATDLEVSFTVQVAGREVKLDANVVLVYAPDTGTRNVLVLSKISFSCWENIARSYVELDQGKLRNDTRWILAHYDPTDRTGVVYLYNELMAAIVVSMALSCA